VFWAGIRASPTVAELASSLDTACAELGIAPETRPFAPHLTLARIKEMVPLAGLRRAIAELDLHDFGAFSPTSFFLYMSEPGPSGSIYTPLHEFPLPHA
jgi:2'-5' RNA ligase